MDRNGNGRFYGGVSMPVGYDYDAAPGSGEIAMSGYAGLTEAQKESIILHCKDVKTKKQMQDVVDAIAPGMDIQEVFEEERDIFL